MRPFTRRERRERDARRQRARIWRNCFRWFIATGGESTGIMRLWL